MDSLALQGASTLHRQADHGLVDGMLPPLASKGAIVVCKHACGSGGVVCSHNPVLAWGLLITYHGMCHPSDMSMAITQTFRTTQVGITVAIWNDAVGMACAVARGPC